MLDDLDKSTLLNLARQTLESYFNREAMPAFQTNRPGLLERKGVFVSLHRGEELRGCIGQLGPDRELFEVVQYCALSSARSDSRFTPVTQDELPDLNIEISVLSLFRRIRDINEIVVGKHGLYIVRGQYRGLLLPQVAAEYNWDRNTFLEQTCRKAGLSGTAWKNPDTEIHIFEADVFFDPESPASGHI